MDQLIQTLGQAMMRHKAISRDDFEVFCYGLDLIFSTLVNAAFVLVISAVIGIFPESFLFYCVFSAIQSTGGGYHATTHFRCFCVTTIGWAVSMFLMHRVGSPLLTVLAAWGIVCTFVFAPIEHKNAPMREKKKAKMKKVVRILACITATASFVMYRYQIALYAPLLAALGAVGASMTGAVIQRHVKKS